MLRVKISALVFLALLCQMLLSSCATNCSNRGDAKSWITAESSSIEKFIDTVDQGESFSEIPDKFIFLVSGPNEAKAEAMLRNTSCIKLSPRKARDLLLENVIVDDGYQPFLVRGVSTRERPSNGNFQCLLEKKSLWVHYSEMGHKSKPARKQPVILFLKEKPQVVIVTYSMTY